MYPVILHLWGPFSIHSYGVSIALGVIIAWHLFRKDRRFSTFFTLDTAEYLVLGLIATAIIFGKIFHLLGEKEFDDSLIDIVAWWTGGFSILGSIIGCLLFGFFFTRYYKLPLIPFADYLSLYTPLLQAFGRLGCFFAGCCFGTSCTYPWAICYQHPLSLAPIGVSLHPVQLYSAVFYALFFALLWVLTKKNLLKKGQTILLYLVGAVLSVFFLIFGGEIGF
jgi:phosphatidylglycerol---prolipoprotein diacylglyceryl transferase